jgi:cell division protein FtsB
VGIRILIPKRKRRTGGVRTRRFLWLAAGAAVWGLAYSMFGATGLVGVYRTEAEVERLEAAVEASRAVNDALAARVDGLRTDPLEIEREARERLGLVKEGDKVYLLPNSPSDEALSPETAESAAPEADSGPAPRP